MLGNSTIQQYFASGDSHYVTPQVSIEWNYNLFYAPYSTTNGTGTRIIPAGTWDNPPSTVSNGRITSVFKADLGLTTRSCYSFAGVNGSGQSTLTISNITSTTNTYKISFYAKVDRDVAVSLSALAYIDYHRAHSQSQNIDSVTWTKFEIYLSSRPTQAPYSNPQLSFHHSTADVSNLSYNILIDQLEIHQTTDFEYQYGNLWTTDSPFHAFRPGESYVPSGNSLVQHSSTFRQIKYDFSSQVANFNNQIMPVSPVLYHPTMMGTNKANPIYKNGFLSEWSQYKYFVADPDTQSITAVYDQTLYVNKLVIKFNLAYSKPSSFFVTISNNTETNSGYTQLTNTVINLTNADIDGSGTCILYLQPDGSWKSGATGYSWTSTPQFDFSGIIRFGGNNGNAATVAINKITLTQNSATTDSHYASYPADVTEMQRMQVVEVSPRLEIDVSYFTMSTDIVAQLDNKMNPLPISAISSNMATITLSNVPLTVSNQVLSLFSNNSTTSILKGLFRNYVKCYVNYVIRDNVTGASTSDKVIPGGVFYVDTWDVKDIEKTVITAYDITKYLQLAQPTDYVSQSEDAFRLISNILDFAGFTDYNYDELRRVTKSTIKLSDGTIQNNSTPLSMRYFYVDGTQQKVFDVLREIFEVYQIAAYIDSSGVMRFINIDGIFDPSNQINMLLHDNKYPQTINTPVGGLTITSNIVQDTYTETTKTKVGKATLTYKTPQLSKKIATDGSLLDNNLYVDAKATFQQSSDVIWDSTIDESTTYNHLQESMSLYQNYFRVPVDEARAASTAQVKFNSYGIDHDGFGIIEGEIVSFKYKEFAFTTPAGVQIRSIANSADFAAQFAEVVSQAGANNNVGVSATGRITNVDRGLFNTFIREHIVMDSNNPSTITAKLDISGASSVTVDKDHLLSLSSLSGEISKITCLDPYSISQRNDYNTFSTKIFLGKNTSTAGYANYPNGTKMGLVLHDTNQNPSMYIGITQQKDSKGNIQYLLTVTSDGTKNLLSSQTQNINVTSVINSQAELFPIGSPFEEYGKFINLKIVKTNKQDAAFSIFLNKEKIPLITADATCPDTSGKFGVFVSGTTGTATGSSTCPPGFSPDGAGYCINNNVPYNIIAAIPVVSSSSSSVKFKEIYATQTAIIDKNIFYHYQLPWFAEKIASNKKIFETSFIVQSQPTIIGINYYDIKDAQAPSLDAYPLKITYDWYYYLDGNLPTPIPANTTTPNLPYIPVDQYSLNYSPIYHSGFRSRFAIVNCSPSQVWIKKSPDPVNKINVDFSLITDSLITLGPDVTIEKVFDQANINETVDITSSWVQDKNTATAILRSIYRALDGFTRDTVISIYGNPLFEIGDIVKVNYGLKNIVNQKYFVQGVQQTFETGLVTILTLNQIG